MSSTSGVSSDDTLRGSDDLLEQGSIGDRVMVRRRFCQLLPLGIAAVGLGLFIYADLTGAHTWRATGVVVVLAAVVVAVWQALSGR